MLLIFIAFVLPWNLLTYETDFIIKPYVSFLLTINNNVNQIWINNIERNFDYLYRLFRLLQNLNLWYNVAAYFNSISNYIDILKQDIYSLLQSTKYFCYWCRKIITNNVRFEETRCIDNQSRYWRLLKKSASRISFGRDERRWLRGSHQNGRILVYRRFFFTVCQ